MQKIKINCIAHAKIKKNPLPLQKLKRICLAHAKNKKNICIPSARNKKKLCPCKKNKTETAIQSQADKKN